MSTRKNSSSALMIFLAFGAVYVIWGSTYFFIRIALEAFPPFMLGALRFIASGALLAGWCILRGERIFQKNIILFASLCGVLMLFVGNGAVIWVEQYLPSAMVAIMVSSAPIWFVILDKPQWKHNLRSKSTIAGLIVGFAGVILLFIERLTSASAESNGYSAVTGLALLLIGSISWAGGSLYSKYKSPIVHANVNSTWQMLAAGVAFVPGTIIRNEWQQMEWTQVSANAWLSVAFLVLMGSLVAFSAYVWLLKVRPAAQVSTYAYVNPVVAVILGVFFANEVISTLQICGLLVILSSVLMINLHKYTQKTTD